MIKKSFITILITAPVSCFAGAFDVLNSNLAASTAAATSSLQATAILWLSSFVLIQMVMTNIGLMKSGADIEAIFGKLIGSLMWFGFCFYVVSNGPDFIKNVSAEFFGVAGNIVGGVGFDPASIVGTGASMAAGLVAQINKATGLTLNVLPAILGGLLGVVILATAALISFKVFLINIETMLIVMLAPLSFAFLGLNALKDQGIAPFKSLISLAYRIIILAILLKAMGLMSDNLINIIDSITSDSIDGIWSALFAAAIGYTLLGFLVFKSDSIAASLASGSTNMGAAEVASAAAIGAAVGGALGAGGDATKSGATKAASGISGMIQKLSGAGGASVSNAGGAGGSGGSSTGARPSPMSTSLATPAGSGAGAKSGGDEQAVTAGATGYKANSPGLTGSGGGDAGDKSGSVGSGGGGSEAAQSDSLASVGSDSGGQVGAVGSNDSPAAASGASGGGNKSAVMDATRSAALTAAAGSARGKQAAAGAPASQAAASDLQKPDLDASSSGKTAGIGDGSAPTPTQTKPTGSSGNRKGGVEYLSDLNKHVANEKSSVSISINTHHSD